jgi:hypothetical protein
LAAGPHLKEAGERFTELVNTLKSIDAKLGTVIKNQETEIRLLRDIKARKNAA